MKVPALTVGAIMRGQGLRALRTRAWKQTTVQDPQAKAAHIRNHMLDQDGKRDFTSSVPGPQLCGDITYPRTGEGWLSLATVIDLCTGMIIGWQWLITCVYDQHTFGNRLAERTAVMDYIEGWYNRRQPNRRAGIPPADALAPIRTATRNPRPRNPNQPQTVSKT